MHRFQRVSATNQTIKAQLFEHERIIVDKEGVGVYDGKEKTRAFDNGRLYLTTHRLFYIDASEPQRNSRYIDLGIVKQTEYWVGFPLKSSPKITLVFASSLVSEGTQSAPSDGEDRQQTALYDDESLHPSAQTWGCRVCGYQNLASGGNKCALCGVTKLASASTIAISSSSSHPSTSARSAMHGPSEPAPNQALNAVDTGNLISCPSCTYLNHPSMMRCEICDSPLGSVSAPVKSGTSSQPATPVAVSGTPSRPGTPSGSVSGITTPTFVRLSFRKGGEKTFYAALKKALQAKEWDLNKTANRRPGTRSSVPPASGSDVDPVSGHRLATFGIDGILRTMDLDARDKEDDMQEALSDLETLMTRAKEMVLLAQSLNEKAASDAEASANAGKVDGANEEVNSVVKRSLASLGLDTPAVTQDMIKDEQEYLRQLARELGTVLLGKGKGKDAAPIMQDGHSRRGLVGLDEIWCLWNRARGVALVSPKDLKQACAYLPLVTTPMIRLRTFKSGLTVLHTPYFSEGAFAERIQASLNPGGSFSDSTMPESASGEAFIEVSGLSSMEIARSEGLSVNLTQQMMELLEDQVASESLIVRDDGDLREGTRWQLNYFAILERGWHSVNK